MTWHRPEKNSKLTASQALIRSKAVRAHTIVDNLRVVAVGTDAANDALHKVSTYLEEIIDIVEADS